MTAERSDPITEGDAGEPIRTTAAAAAALAESNRLLTMAEGLAGVGHWHLNATDQTVFWSDEVYRIHGRDPSFKPVLADGLAAYHPDDLEMVEAHVEASLLDGTPSSFQARIVRPNGEIRHVLSKGQVERAADGTITGLFGVFQDITARIESETALIAARDEAERSANAKSAFLATMSHEIRTPMTGVLGMIGLLRSAVSREDRDRYLDNLEQSAHLLMKVLDDVLDYSKLESGAVALEAIDFDIGALARSTLDLFRNSASAKGLPVSLACPVGEPLLVRGDPVRIQQVISNLVSNAIKFTAQGQVELRLSAKGTKAGRREWRIEVRDTGIGIAEGDIARLFEPFVQADASTTREYGGTGLGLAISRKLVEAMDGRIGIESEPGKGSNFWFRIELGIASGADAPEPEPTVRPAGRVLSVLVAEDNLINQALVTALVEREGHRVTCVGNGRLAVEAAAAARFDVILMDMQMPEMDGLAATAAIRAGDGPSADVPIVALTADTSPERRGLYTDSGLTAFLTKPIEIPLLAKLLGELSNAPAALALAAAPATITETSDILDESRLRAIEEAVGPDNVRRLLDLFVDDARTRPAVIARLIALGSIGAAQSEAHSLKGAAHGVGAMRVMRDAAAIEDAAPDGTDFGALADALVVSAEITVSECTARIARLGDG